VNNETYQFKNDSIEVFDDILEYITYRLVIKSMPQKFTIRLKINNQLINKTSAKNIYEEYNKMINNLKKMAPNLIVQKDEVNSANISELEINWR
jgi:hypothetical protein